MLKVYFYDPVDCVKPSIAREAGKVYKFFSTRFVLVSDPGSVSPFFREELLSPVLLSLWTKEKGDSSRRGLYDERRKEVNLFQIYKMDFGNAM
uniref:hypothetical protein n=1 Tax=Drosera capensis TaxID=4366 RepID=UPI002410CA74|nr:hypothetical protein P8577_pgp049 [Drosera capensis]YP_010737258.1 hypothetical protein P8577_pgp006 [Drosera capensis]WEQ03474.1 hypothetical protein [Drosera capensis]WEQ03517.1 hypothetical protein [Drosera capensis]